MSSITRALCFTVFAIALLGCSPYREVQRLETASGWSVLVEMEKYDDGPTAGMIGTVFDAEGKAVQKPMAVGASYDRGKSGGFLLYEVDDLVALVAEEKPRDVLLLFDYKGNIWPRRFDGDREAMRRARTWYDESLPVVLAGLECPPDSDR